MEEDRISDQFNIVRNILQARGRHTAARSLSDAVQEAVSASWLEFLARKRHELSYEGEAEPHIDEQEFFLAAGGTSIDAVRVTTQIMESLQAWLAGHEGISVMEFTCEGVASNVLTEFRGLAHSEAIREAIYDHLMHRPIHELASIIETLLRRLDSCLDKDPSIEPPPKKQRRLDENNEQDSQLEEVLLKLVEQRYKPLWSMGRTNRLISHNQISVDRPLWKSFTHDSQSTPIRMSLKWKRSLGKCIDATPLVTTFGVWPSKEEDTYSLAFVGSHSGLFEAIDLETGGSVWSRNLRTRIESSCTPSKSGEGALTYLPLPEYRRD